MSGLWGSLIATAVRHFPGHGNADVNSRKVLPVLSQSLAQLTPRSISRRSGRRRRVRTWSSSATSTYGQSTRECRRRFRRKCRTGCPVPARFGGVVITDALDIAPVTQRWSAGEAAVRAILAGDDMLLMPADLLGAT